MELLSVPRRSLFSGVPVNQQHTVSKSGVSGDRNNGNNGERQAAFASLGRSYIRVLTLPVVPIESDRQTPRSCLNP